MKSLILASGFGTRLYPLTINKAKGLLEYKGKPIISQIVDKIPPGMEIFVNTNKKFEADFCRWRKTIVRKITLCVEPVLSEVQAFGAIGSIDYWIKTKEIDDDLLVIASDNYFEFDLRRFIANYDGNDVLVALYNISNKVKTSQFGIAQIDEQKIISFEEKPSETRGGLIATACYIFPSRIFPLLASYCNDGNKNNLGSFIAYLIDRDEVQGFVFSEPWIDIGNIDSSMLS